MRHIGPPVKAVNVKFASKDLIIYIISRPESWSVPQKRDARSLYARRQGGKTCLTLHPTIRASTCFMVSRRAA